MYYLQDIKHKLNYLPLEELKQVKVLVEKLLKEQGVSEKKGKTNDNGKTITTSGFTRT